MKNKVLVKIIFPETEDEFDVFIPVNEYVWKVNKLITKTICDLVGIEFNLKTTDYVFFNKTDGTIYKSNDLVINTNIRNGTELVMLRTINK